MRNLYCDAFLCACPTVEEGQARFEGFLAGIMFLRDLPRTKWLKLCISNDTTYALYRENRYPIRPNLEQSIATFGSSELQAEDIIQIVDGLFKRVEILETLTGIDDYLFEDFQVEPQFTAEGRGQFLAHAFDKFVLLSAHDCLTSRGGGPPFQLLTKDIVMSNERVRVAGRIVHTEGPAQLSLPLDVVANGEFHQSFVSLCSGISTHDAWLESSDEHDYRATLKVHLVRAAHALEIPESDIRGWSFGPRFLRSITSLPFDDEAKTRRLLKACSEAILRQNLGAIHALRTSAGGNSGQVVRGAFRAWRRDIDYEYHLHYWDDGTSVEFSAVTIHNDFSIC